MEARDNHTKLGKAKERLDLKHKICASRLPQFNPETHDEDGSSKERGHNSWKRCLEPGPVKDSQRMRYHSPNVKDT